MADPKVRLWLIFIESYGTNSFKRYLDFSQMFREGDIFKLPRVVRTRGGELHALTNDAQGARSDPLRHPLMKPLRAFLKERAGGIYEEETAREITRLGGAEAHKYFTSHTCEWAGEVRGISSSSQHHCRQMSHHLRFKDHTRTHTLPSGGTSCAPRAGPAG